MHSQDTGVELLRLRPVTDLDYAHDIMLLFKPSQKVQTTLDSLSRSILAPAKLLSISKLYAKW